MPCFNKFHCPCWLLTTLRPCIGPCNAALRTEARLTSTAAQASQLQGQPAPSAAQKPRMSSSMQLMLTSTSCLSSSGDSSQATLYTCAWGQGARHTKFLPSCLTTMLHRPAGDCALQAGAARQRPTGLHAGSRSYIEYGPAWSSADAPSAPRPGQPAPAQPRRRRRSLPLPLVALSPGTPLQVSQPASK